MVRGKHQEEVWLFPGPNGVLPPEVRGQPLPSHICRSFAVSVPAWEVGRAFWAK